MYITLEEAAAFEGIGYKGLTSRIARNPKQYETKPQPREGGGKDQVLISVSSLSAKARRAWRARQKVDGRDVIIDQRTGPTVPWYVTADLNQYIEGHEKAYYEAVEAAQVVQDFINYAGPEKKTVLAARLAVGLGVSPQSFYRYQTQVLEANAWALKLAKEDGQCRDYFRALALCRKPKAADTFPSRTVMSGSISKGKNDPSQSLQMIERPLMTSDELKSIPKGQFVVMKTGTHPMQTRLRLFLEWGIQFEEPYQVEEKSQRTVAYASKQELEQAILQRHPAEPKAPPVPSRPVTAAGGAQYGRNRWRQESEMRTRKDGEDS